MAQYKDVHYRNPIPYVDAETVSNVYSASWTFQEPVTLKTATKSILDSIAREGAEKLTLNPGKPVEMIDPARAKALDRYARHLVGSTRWKVIPGTERVVLCENCQKVVTNMDYAYCPFCGAHVEKDKELPEIMRDTPAGTIDAKVMPDEEYPGICVTVTGNDGQEISAAILEWHPLDKRFKLRVYGYTDPTGDPIEVIDMSDGKHTIIMDEEKEDGTDE